MASPCLSVPHSREEVIQMFGNGPFELDSLHKWQGHIIQILANGTGIHKDCTQADLNAASQEPSLKKVSTSPLWIGVALLAAGTIIDIVALLGHIPLGPVGSPVFTAAFGATFIASLVYTARQHGSLQCTRA